MYINNITFTITKVNIIKLKLAIFCLTLPVPFDYNISIVFPAIKKVVFIKRCAREEAILPYTIKVENLNKFDLKWRTITTEVVLLLAPCTRETGHAQDAEPLSTNFLFSRIRKDSDNFSAAIATSKSEG